MSIFGKSKGRPVGPSFPFLERDSKTLRMKYDGLEVDHSDSQVTLTFMQGDVPVYAYTIDCPVGSTATFTMMSGVFEIAFSHR